MAPSAKCTTIRHIVRLRQMLRRWRLRACSSAAPSDVPAGHVAVCVGSKSRRFVVRAVHLNHPAFRKLLSRAEEEYGFTGRPGPITIPVDEGVFEDVLRRLSNGPDAGCHAEGMWRETMPLLRGVAGNSSA